MSMPDDQSAVKTVRRGKRVGMVFGSIIVLFVTYVVLTALNLIPIPTFK